MARPAKFSDDQILDAGLALVAAGGPQALSVSAIAKGIGAPSGSIYHRFASRDLLVAHLWLRTVSTFQDGYLDVLHRHDDPFEAARAGAAHVLQWSSDHPAEVRLIVLHRSEDLLADEWPQDLRDRNRAQRERITTELRALARRLGASGRDDLRRLVFACVEVPTAEVRHCLARGTTPDRMSRRLVDETVTALLSRFVDSPPTNDRDAP